MHRGLLHSRGSGQDGTDWYQMPPGAPLDFGEWGGLWSAAVSAALTLSFVSLKEEKPKAAETAALQSKAKPNPATPPCSPKSGGAPDACFRATDRPDIAAREFAPSFSCLICRTMSRRLGRTQRTRVPSQQRREACGNE